MLVSTFMVSTFVACVSGQARRARACCWCAWAGAVCAVLRFFFWTLYSHCSLKFLVVGFGVTLHAFNFENHGVSAVDVRGGSSVLLRGGIDSSRRKFVTPSSM